MTLGKVTFETEQIAMKNKYLYIQYTKTYFGLRKAVGLIGILLPFVLMAGNFLYFDGEVVLPSISQYYHSPMRDVFVGGLLSIASFLFFYSGYGKADRIVGIVAGILALGVVFFPTSQSTNSGGGAMHGVFAISLFVTLALISIFDFPRKRPGTPKQITDTLQIICGLIILCCVIAVCLYYVTRGFAKSEGCFVFIAESIALIAFGVSWFTEGMDLKREISSEQSRQKFVRRFSWPFPGKPKTTTIGILQDQ